MGPGDSFGGVAPRDATDPCALPMIDLPLPPADDAAAPRARATADLAITLASSRLAALHAYLRAAAVVPGDGAVPAPLRAAVRDYRVIDAALPAAIRLPSGEEFLERGAHDRCARERYWHALDADVFGSACCDALRERGAHGTARIDGLASAEGVVARIADALAAGADAYAREIWPTVAGRLAEWCRWWAASVGRRSGATVTALRRALGVGDGVPSPRVFVVPRARHPSAAYRTVGGPLVVVDVGRHGEGDLVAAVFHEIAHALDGAAPEAGTLGILRRALRSADVPAETAEQTVRATIAALAASVTRDELDAGRGDADARHGAGAWAMERLHDVVDAPVRALRAGRTDAAGFARRVAEVVGRG